MELIQHKPSELLFHVSVVSNTEPEGPLLIKVLFSSVRKSIEPTGAGTIDGLSRPLRDESTRKLDEINSTAQVDLHRRESLKNVQKCAGTE